MDFSRQAGYVAHDRPQSIILAGCGSVGRQIALALGAMGFADRLTIFDPDSVREENLCTQGWHPTDIGRDKAMVLHDDLGGVCEWRNVSYNGSSGATVVITALDSIKARETIARNLARYRAPSLLIDPRQSPTGCRIVSMRCEDVIHDDDDRRTVDSWLDRYLATLPTEPANTGCVRPQTYWQSLDTASKTLRQLSMYSVGLDAECDYVCDNAYDDAPAIFSTEVSSTI